MLEIINAQGAQVKALEQQVEIRNLIIALLTFGKPANMRFSKQKIEQLTADISVQWKQNKDGTIVVNVKKKGSNK